MTSVQSSLKSQCRSLSGHGFSKPAAVLAEIADWCKQHDCEFEAYGSGDLIESFERKIADLLGFPAARFMPSGVLAQLTALRIWSDRSGCSHFAMHPTSHIELHEESGYRHLYGLTATLVGPHKSPLLADHFDALTETFSTLLIELPIREAGGQLPTWEALEALKHSAKARCVRLHLDGARLWETKQFYNREYSEICAGFDSVYVSFYKGIGALPGAMLLGPEDFIAEAKLWQRRAGGTLQTLASNVASAAMKFDSAIARFPAYFARTISLVKAIEGLDDLVIMPPLPQVNMLHIYLPCTPERADAARDQIAAEFSLWLFNKANQGDSANSCYFELYIGEALMDISDPLAAQVFARLLAIIRAG